MRPIASGVVEWRQLRGDGPKRCISAPSILAERPEGFADETLKQSSAHSLLPGQADESAGDIAHLPSSRPVEVAVRNQYAENGALRPQTIAGLAPVPARKTVAARKLVCRVTQAPPIRLIAAQASSVEADKLAQALAGQGPDLPR